MNITDDGVGCLRITHRGEALGEYVYRPAQAAAESPRPFARLRSRRGVEVTGYRPADHVWHAGLSLALPVVGEHNFWGGPTYVHGEGYLPLPNNGTQVHRAFRHHTEGAHVDETLDWVAATGLLVLTEQRSLVATVVDDDTWMLGWQSTLRNVSGRSLAFGSPATKGRSDAGYAGIFWRGAESFTGAEITHPGGTSGESARGAVSPWLSMVAPDGSAGVAMIDESGQTPWFARSTEYAGLGPAPFSYTEQVLPDGEELTLEASLVIGGIDVAERAADVLAAREKSQASA